MRVPLPQPLLRSEWSLGKTIETLYSVHYHPLCMLEEAWRFAKELCFTPTDADLRAALLYQIIFGLHKRGPISFWGTLGVDRELRVC